RFTKATNVGLRASTRFGTLW
ncbi:hypothetical protein D044_1610B, partial [Vibrio parahaemolyticus EKP-026]